jgi:hypothetical protein
MIKNELHGSLIPPQVPFNSCTLESESDPGYRLHTTGSMFCRKDGAGVSVRFHRFRQGHMQDAGQRDNH